MPPRTALQSALGRRDLDLKEDQVRLRLRRWLGWEADRINRARSREDVQLVMGSTEAVDAVFTELLASVWTSPDALCDTAMERLGFFLNPGAKRLRAETVVALEALFSGVWSCMALSFQARMELLQRSRAWTLLRAYLATQIRVEMKLDPLLEVLDWPPILEDFLEKAAAKFAIGALRGPVERDVNYLSCALIQGKPLRQIPSVLVKAALRKRRREAPLELPDEDAPAREPRQQEPILLFVELEEIIQWDERLAGLAAAASTRPARLALKALRLYARLRVGEEAPGRGILEQVYSWMELIGQAGEDEALRERLLDQALGSLPLRTPGLPSELDAWDMRLASRSRRGYELSSMVSVFFGQVQGLEQNSAKKRLERVMASLLPILRRTGVDPFQLQAWIMEKDDPDLGALVKAALRSDEEPAKYRRAVAKHGAQIEDWMEKLRTWSPTPPTWLWRILTLAKQSYAHE